MRAIVVLVCKDLIIEVRTRELVTSMSLVAFLSLVILSLAAGQSSDGCAATGACAAAPSIVWVTVAFAATLGLARSQALEQERQAIQGVLLTPIGRTSLFLAKYISNLLLVLFLEAAVVLFSAALVNADVGRRAAVLALPLVLGAVGFTAAGTLLGAITVTTRLREVLLPILLLPVVLPVIIVSLSAMADALVGAPLGALAGRLRFLVACDVIFVVLGMLLYQHVVEE
jgi:heme exporter protein B